MDWCKSISKDSNIKRFFDKTSNHIDIWVLIRVIPLHTIFSTYNNVYRFFNSETSWSNIICTHALLGLFKRKIDDFPSIHLAFSHRKFYWIEWKYLFLMDPFKKTEIAKEKRGNDMKWQISETQAWS